MLRHRKQTLKPWSYSTRTRAGNGKPEEHFPSSVHSDLPSALLPWLVWHRGCFPKSHQPRCASNTQELMGEFMAGSSHFPGHLQATQVTLDKRQSFLSQLQLPTMGNAMPWYICSRLPLQLHTNPATSGQSSLTEQLLCCPHCHFTFSSLNLLFISKIHRIHFDIL